jgi:hypothetical protein
MKPNPVQSMNRGFSNTSRSTPEVSKILAAAVISAQFRQMLLANPEKAISAGFGGEMFNLPREEKKRLASIRATSLADFASQVNRTNESRPGFSAFGGD